MHVADRDTMPGKKFWTWGNGPDGRTWDRILTDEDGPYLELMSGDKRDQETAEQVRAYLLDQLVPAQP